MSKSLAIIGLLMVILVSFGFVTLKLAASADEHNWFNKHWRSTFAANPRMRGLLGLHFDGDGRADYLGPQTKHILIEVDAMDSVPVDYQALDMLISKIGTVTGKDVEYVVSDQNVPVAKVVNKEKIGDIVKQYRNFENHGDTATVYLLFMNEYTDESKLLGLTYKEYGIVIFAKALQDFTDNNRKALLLYEESTALHEFGHQIGMNHNNEPGCLMNEHAESAHMALQNPQDVITDFCAYEKALLK